VKSILFKKKYRQIIIGFSMLFTVIVCAIFAPWIASHDPEEYNVPHRLKAPSSLHFFGTDQFGRDVFSRVVYGARVTMIVGVSVTALCGLAGIILGMIAGYYSRLETVIMRVMDGLMAFPSILLALVIVAALGPGIGNVIMALAVANTPQVARLVRSTVLVIKQFDHVEAARAAGARGPRILFFHILPLCWSPIIVFLTLILAYTAISEASLTFLGVGLPPDIPSWGSILSEGRLYMEDAPWITFIPGLAIMISVFSLNLLGDGLRDFLDPRLKNT